MSKYTCSTGDCTVALTNKCLLSHVPPESCPHLHLSTTDGIENEPEERINDEPAAAIYNGNELGLEQATEILASRYGHLIGVLGAHATGKTCLLCSLYLLASCGDLHPKTLFAGSLTLPGFESRLRRLRSWPKEGLPDKIIDHTVLAHPRQPGLLHVALLQTTPVRSLRDLFFTDLPGEWTTDLINRTDVAERFRFLRRADGIVIALPAPGLLADETRHSQVQSMRILLQRLRHSVGLDRTVPIVLAITRCDLTGPAVPQAVYQVADFGREIGFSNISYVPIAAFSASAEVPSGMGLGALIEAVLQGGFRRPPSASERSKPSRMFARFQCPLEVFP